MCPGLDSRTRRHMWVEFVGSLLCSERFLSGYSGFPLSSKSTFDLIYSQGEAGPPSEKELVSNAVQQAVSPSGTIKFLLLIM